MQPPSPLPTSWAFPLREAYARVGLLVPLGLLALAGGAWIQHVRPELPSVYTWLQPYDTLKVIVQMNGVPSAVAFAYLLGAAARLELSGVRAWFASLRQIKLTPERRTPALLRTLIGVVLVALDVAFLPYHGPLDAIAVGVLGGLLAKPYPRAAWQRLLQAHPKSVYAAQAQQRIAALSATPSTD